MTDDFVAVIDGSTSKADVRYSPDVSNGRLCMEIVSRVISEKLTPDSTITDFCRLTAEAVSEYYPQKPTKADNNLMAASAVVLNVRKREVWFVGDCLCLVDGVLYEYPKPEEVVNAEKRSKYIHELLKEGRAMVEGRLPVRYSASVMTSGTSAHIREPTSSPTPVMTFAV